MPRHYNLGKRAGQKAETTQRIIDAAAALYQEHGISATTMLEVARRADVAPGTVLNHFSSADALAKAVVDQVVGSLRLPSERIFNGVDAVPDRVDRLAHELLAFYDRSESWYAVWAREPTGVAAWAAAEADFYAAFDRLIRAALGPLSGQESNVMVVSTALGAEVYSGLRARGLATSQVAATVIDLLRPWLESRLRLSEPD
jgi:AcrR family transcriptional regulator